MELVGHQADDQIRAAHVFAQLRGIGDVDGDGASSRVVADHALGVLQVQAADGQVDVGRLEKEAHDRTCHQSRPQDAGRRSMCFKDKSRDDPPRGVRTRAHQNLG